MLDCHTLVLLLYRCGVNALITTIYFHHVGLNIISTSSFTFFSKPWSWDVLKKFKAERFWYGNAIIQKGKSNRKAMNRNWGNQKANPAL